MKNTIRVRKNGAKKARSPQVLTTSSTIHSLLDTISGGRELETKIDALDDDNLQQLALCLESEARKVRSIQSGRAGNKASPAAELFSPLLKLDSAVDGASALLELLAEKVLELRRETAREGDEVERGIGFLAQGAIVKLRETLSGVTAAFAPAPAHGGAR